MINILLYLSTGLILVGFIGYILLIMLGDKKVTDSDGFNITKDIISKYNTINIIESKNYFTMYNIKRKVIKLSSKCYYGNDISSISVALIEAGISVIDSDKNKYIDLFRNIFSNLKILYIFPIIAIFINHATYNISDAKVSMLFIIIFSVITYMFIDIKNQAYSWINDNIEKIKEINKDNRIKIFNFISKLIFVDKIIFFGELVMIIRMVAILLEIN